MPAYQACARLGLSGRVAVADAKPRSNVFGDPDSWPWFSGFCLEGEVAKIYHVDDHDPDDGRLILNGLAPVTIFCWCQQLGQVAVDAGVVYLQVNHLCSFAGVSGRGIPGWKTCHLLL